MARTLLASIPSGSYEIVNLRNVVSDGLIGPGWSNRSWVLPTVAHPGELLSHQIFGPRVIFVGHAIGWLQNTPWVNPCALCPVYDHNDMQLTFRTYCDMRADLCEFLLPLFGCHLVCSCRMNAAQWIAG